MPELIASMRQRGDTIVEVLLAIAVMSSILGAAFVSVNKSYIGTKQSQERTEATKLLQSQLERLKEAAKTSSAVFDGPNPFCVLATNNPAMPLEVVTDTHSGCMQGATGRFTLSIRRATDNATFTARARWARSGGEGGQEEAIMTYRVYEDEN